jgi:hypothetical protein
MADIIDTVLQWIKDFFTWLFQYIWAQILEALAAVINAIPVPDFVYQAQSAFSSLSGNVLFFAQKFAFGEGVAMILAAYAIRFLIRRIPIIG